MVPGVPQPIGSTALTLGCCPLSGSPAHIPTAGRHPPIVTRLPPGGQDHKVLGLGITAEGRADDVVDGIVLVHLVH